MSVAGGPPCVISGALKIVVWRRRRDNILWSEKILQKGGKNTKKGVDKGHRVWYISKALGARGSAEAGRSRKLRGNRKKGLTNPGGRGKMAKFAGRGARMKSLGLRGKKLAEVEKRA